MQELTKLIQEACPELMELSFGCELKVKNVEALCICIDNGGYKNTETGANVYYDVRKKDELIKVLGHPIQLAYVLKAIGVDIALCRGGDSLEIASDSGHCDWNLSLPLSEQSPETIAFLLSILKK